MPPNLQTVDGRIVFFAEITLLRIVGTGIFFALFPNAKPAENGVEQVFRRHFAVPAVQALSRIKRAMAS